MVPLISKRWVSASGVTEQCGALSRNRDLCPYFFANQVYIQAKPEITLNCILFYMQFLKDIN